VRLRREVGWLKQNFSRKIGFEHGQKGQPDCPWWADRLTYREAYLQGMGPAPQTPDKHDYYALIVRAVATLSDNTPDTRKTLYKRARMAQTGRLNNVDPPLSMAEMSCECEALEHAIRLVEFEVATGSTKAQGPRLSIIAEQKGRRSGASPSGDSRVRGKASDDEVPTERGSVVRLREHRRQRR